MVIVIEAISVRLSDPRWPRLLAISQTHKADCQFARNRPEGYGEAISLGQRWRTECSVLFDRDGAELDVRVCPAQPCVYVSESLCEFMCAHVCVMCMHFVSGVMCFVLLLWCNEQTISSLVWNDCSLSHTKPLDLFFFSPWAPHFSFSAPSVLTAVSSWSFETIQLEKGHELGKFGTETDTSAERSLKGNPYLGCCSVADHDLWPAFGKGETKREFQ